MTDNILMRVGSLETAAEKSREAQAQRNAELNNRIADLEGAVGLGLPHGQAVAFPAIDAAYPASSSYCQQPFVTGLSIAGEPLLAQGAEPIAPQWAQNLRNSLDEIKRELADRRNTGSGSNRFDPNIAKGFAVIAEEALRDEAPKRRSRPPGSRNRAKTVR